MGRSQRVTPKPAMRHPKDQVMSTATGAKMADQSSTQAQYWRVLAVWPFKTTSSQATVKAAQ